MNYKIRDLSEDYSAIGRIINGIAISQGLNDGSVDVKEVVSELSNLKPGTTLDALESENVVGLANDLSQISSLVDTETAKDGRDDFKYIREGMPVFERVASLPLPNHNELFRNGSSIMTMIRLKEVFTKLTEYRKYFIELMKHLTSLKHDVLSENEVENTGWQMIGNIYSIIDKKVFKTNFTSEEIEVLEEEKLNAAFDEVMKLKVFYSSLESNGVTLKFLKYKMENMVQMTPKMQDILSRGVLSKIERKMRVLISVINSPRLSIEEKKYTHGFFNGVDDLYHLEMDINSSLVKNILTNTSSFQNLKNMQIPITNLKNPIQALHYKLNGVKILDKTNTNLLAELEAAKNETESLHDLYPFYECLKKMDRIYETTALDSWGYEMERVHKMKTNATLFAEKFNTFSIKLDKFFKFKKVVEHTNVMIYVENVKKYSEFEKLVAELRNASNELQNLEAMVLEWAKWTETEWLALDTEKWLIDSDFNFVSECIQSKEMVSSVKVLFGNEKKNLDALLKLKSDNKNLIEISKAAKAQQATIKLWNEVKETQKKRTIRAINTYEKLENAFKVTRDLSVGVKVFRDLAVVHNLRNEMKELLDSEQIIEEAIKKTSDAGKKKELMNLWNDDTKMALKNHSALMDELNKTIIYRPTSFSNFSTFFDMNFNFKNGTNLKLSSLSYLFRSVGLWNLDQTLRKLLVLDDLNFSNSKKSMKPAADAFHQFFEFFNSYPPRHGSKSNQMEQEKVPKNPYQSYHQTKEEEVQNNDWEKATGVIILIGIAIVFMIGASIYVAWISISDKIKKKKRKLESKKKTKDAITNPAPVVTENPET